MRGIEWSRVEPPDTQIENVVIVASGRSVSTVDLILISNAKSTHIIGVNDSGKHIPRMDSWITIDPWGLNGPQLPTKPCTTIYAAVPEDFGTVFAKTSQHRISAPTTVKFLHRLRSHNKPNVSSTTAFRLGLSDDMGCISTGNSGYGALNLAYHLRPKRIFLVGIDGDVNYFYSPTKGGGNLSALPQLFESSVEQFRDANIAVFNVNPKSTVTCFPFITPDEFHEMLIR